MKKLRMKLLPPQKHSTLKYFKDPQTHAFVYPRPPEEPFVIKGPRKEVVNWMAFNLYGPAIVHYVTETSKGTKNCYCSLENMGNLRIRRQIPTKYTWNRRFYYIVDVKGSQLLPIMELRKIPRCWMPELEPYIPVHILKRLEWQKEKKIKVPKLKAKYDDFEEMSFDFGIWVEP
jgi:hypothetical protein